jgi:hypothetical protein
MRSCPRFDGNRVSVHNDKFRVKNKISCQEHLLQSFDLIKEQRTQVCFEKPIICFTWYNMPWGIAGGTEISPPAGTSEY